ncbi:cupin domain-containing protein [Aquabacterium sp. OR-4]|uniref:cupin domain-containing protein n=1 Tax=Aquabacterium sp. OR-4 TaxID=2978127 RepID=UPI0028C51FAE|nr:cupin domain-containing protein [Aquabacterium sp. OR-4]MDT7838663.1 cupin domain-containing protein [Aquabacterium sp. OR-4]
MGDELALGRLEDLPADYVAELRALNLVPLWPSLRAVLPPARPRPATQATHWSYQALRPLLLRAGELTPIEKAERRVLVLANPGHGRENMKASPAMYLGMQLLLPGEWAPSHRHTPNAVRMVVEGEGAWTTVDGEQCPMLRGDLILTPTGLWHEHGHDGSAPVVWLDVLDLPLVYYMEASYHVNGSRQALRDRRADAGVAAPPAGQPADGAPAGLGSGQGACHGSGHGSGLVPTPVFGDAVQRYPMLRYPWAQARAALLALADAQPARATVQLTYVNPETGDDAENILGFHALMLRPGQTLTLPASSPAQVFHLIEGGVDVQVATDPPKAFTLAEADTCCAPGYTPVTLRNRAGNTPAFVFVADESPLHRKLGVLETR